MRKKVLFSFGKGVVAPGVVSELIAGRKNYDKVFIFLPFAECLFIPFIFKKEQIFSFYVCDLNLGSGIIMKLIEKFYYFSAAKLLNKSSTIIPLSDDFMFHSKAFREELRHKVKVLFPRIIPPDISATASEISAYHRRFGIKDTDFVIGFLGRIVYEKGIEYLLDAIPYLDKSLPDFKILIGGDYQNVRGGSTYDQLRQKIAKYADKVAVTGFVPEAEKGLFFKSIDILVLPSIDPLEAFGIVQVEAMIAGKPVVASSLYGVREVIKNTKFGYTAEKKSAEDLAAKILLLHGNLQKLQVHKDSYKKYYSDAVWKQQLEKIIDVS